MKILYAVQATGNGHISRAMELLPYLEQYGMVDIFLSGANSSLGLDAPVKYRSKGLSLFYTAGGGLDYLKMAYKFSPLRIAREVRDLPVEKYDLVINDFESITAMACAYKKVPSVNFGHQASFQSPEVPRPVRTSAMGEWILRNYAKATEYIGLHFQTYDDFILTPVIKEEIRQAEPVNNGHITVYLSSYSDQQLIPYLQQANDLQFEVFSKEVKEPVRLGNITLLPVSKALFNQSLASCAGIITGAGFETPAEALYLGKKVMVIPIRGQYEQLCNAAALEPLGIPVIDKPDQHFATTISRWMSEPNNPAIHFKYSTGAIIDFMMCRCTSLKYRLDLLYPEMIFN